MNIIRIKTISAFHKWRALPTPAHPLISLVDYAALRFLPTDDVTVSAVFDFYSIAIKRDPHGKLFYGQGEYDFDEGFMFFTAPNQVLKLNIEQSASAARSGWLLFIHPDFFWNTPLAKNIKQYAYFNYSVNEALFLSEKEEASINNIIQNIQQEYLAAIDKFSQSIIVSQIEALLNYAERFYQRQFITRSIPNHKLLNRLEELLSTYMEGDNLTIKGLPTVQYISDTLHISPNYLRSVLKVLTGKSTQQHIHDKLIEKAKEKLSLSDLSVSEIAYELGFEHPQSFSKLFKLKTLLSPLQFRQSFN